MLEIDLINTFLKAISHPIDSMALVFSIVYTALINNPLEAFGVIAGIVGSFYIAGRNKKAFVFWTASNIAMLIVMINSGLHFAAFMYFYYLINSMFGYMNWRKKELRA